MAVLASMTSTYADQPPATVSVDDPRPLSAAVRLLDRHCHCPITYEDPKSNADDAVDVSASVWHAPNVKPYIPKGGRFSFTLPERLAQESSFNRQGSVEEVLDRFERSKAGRGHFKVVRDDGTIHVVPRSGSVLDAPVTLRTDTQPMSVFIMEILNAVAEVTGEKIGLATGPINFLNQKATFTANGEPARIALARVLQEGGRELSWRLAYDFGMGRYYLGIHAVPKS